MNYIFGCKMGRVVFIALNIEGRRACNNWVLDALNRWAL